MLLLSLLIIPVIGILIITIVPVLNNQRLDLENTNSVSLASRYSSLEVNINNRYRQVGLITTIVNLVISIFIFIGFNFSNSGYQYVQEYHEFNYILMGYMNTNIDFYLGIDGLSIYFVLLTTIIMPIAILSNWKSIKDNIKSYIIIMLLLETLLLAVFLVLDILAFYIFFESILPPLFVLIGIFGSSNRVRASFYLFLYTLLGSLFLLLSILTMSSIMGTTDYSALYKTNFSHLDFQTNIALFIGIALAFAVKTPVIFLNSWLLKAHVESPLGGSIILAAIVLKLSLYGIVRLILPLLPKASYWLVCLVYVVAIITILYASFSTLRTVDVKELIAYSSVSHAAVYILGIFSNSIIGINGAIILGLAHGFVSSGLFICVGGVLYDRSHTRLISYYRGITQIMPVFSILFFILCLANCGTPLTLNFLGEFMCLYGSFEQIPVLGLIASSSIVLSAAYTMYMYNRIAFGGAVSKYLLKSFSDVNKREFILLIILISFTISLGVYPSPIIDGLNYNTSALIYNV